MVSSIRLFGQLAPAVMPTVMVPAGSQLGVVSSTCVCWFQCRISVADSIIAAFLMK